MTRAAACANVALVKYWGKRDLEANLPAVGSISLTLDGLEAQARISASPRERRTRRGAPVTGKAHDAMVQFLDWLAASRGHDIALAVDIETNFPVAAGLASSELTQHQAMSESDVAASVLRHAAGGDLVLAGSNGTESFLPLDADGRPIAGVLAATALSLSLLLLTVAMLVSLVVLVVLTPQSPGMPELLVSPGVV